MVFSSVLFLFYFLPLFLAAYYLLPWRNLTLTLASFVFYAWGEPRYAPLLIMFILLNWGVGRLMARDTGRAQAWMAVGIVGNLGLLAYFKYANFFAAQAEALGLYQGAWPKVVLPLGISFIAFQGVSYLIDLKRGRVAAQRSLLSFAMYKSMFPQLIAGPIVRYADIEAKIDHRGVGTLRAYLGTRLFLVGLAQKVLIANTVAVPADQIFALPAESLTPAVAWLGALCYTAQIYFDFAGYSTMAIGLGHLIGFSFPRNFDLPYRSRSITEFWRRWHMSLSSWFRDYLYVPLGGNRLGALRTYANLWIVFLLCGLWHGAAWTFVAWGAWHGALLVVERLGLRHVLAKSPAPVAHLWTMLAVIAGWVVFRADTLPHAFAYLGTMAGAQAGDPLAVPLMRWLTGSVATALLVGAVLSVTRPRLGPKLSSPAFRLAVEPAWQAVAADAGLLLAGFVCATSLASGTYNPFIYFRF